MRYTSDALNLALEILIPNYDRISHVQPRPEWLQTVAHRYFMEHFPNSDRRDLQRMEAFDVCKDALVSLGEHGCFIYGEKEMEFCKSPDQTEVAFRKRRYVHYNSTTEETSTIEHSQLKHSFCGESLYRISHAPVGEQIWVAGGWIAVSSINP